MLPISGATTSSFTVNRSRLSAAAVWRQGYLSFDKTTLADAVAEFNRYNKRKIVQIPQSPPFAAAISVQRCRWLSTPHCLISR
jgi:hypothetical protein